jgi:alkanesulfonate monooxygenase SsuD/methylene tetrahydromethanopterin reductase-like flavin-dependent oxidoreductase (luciferase family)
VCLGHDEEHALAALRQATAMYAGLPAYRRQLAAVGLGGEADAAAGAQRSGDLDDVPVRLVRAVSVWGDRDDAMARLEAWREAGADLVVVYPVTAQEAASSLMGTIMAAAPTPAVEH